MSIYEPKKGDVVRFDPNLGYESLVVEDGLRDYLGMSGYAHRLPMLGRDTQHDSDKFTYPERLTFVRRATQTELEDYGLAPMPKCPTCGKPERPVRWHP